MFNIDLINVFILYYLTNILSKVFSNRPSTFGRGTSLKVCQMYINDINDVLISIIVFFFFFFLLMISHLVYHQLTRYTEHILIREVETHKYLKLFNTQKSLMLLTNVKKKKKQKKTNKQQQKKKKTSTET